VLVGLVERLPAEHFVEDHAERPHIALLAVATGNECLRRHVAGRADVVVAVWFGVAGYFAVAEVADLGLAVMHKYIRWFEIAVRNLLLNAEFVSLDNTVEDVERVVLVETA